MLGGATIDLLVSLTIERLLVHRDPFFGRMWNALLSWTRVGPM